MNNSNYFHFFWSGNTCKANTLEYGTSASMGNYINLEPYDYYTEFYVYGFGPDETYYFQLHGTSNQTSSDVIVATSSWVDCSDDGGDGGGDSDGAHCDNAHYCSDCDGCESNCCPNYCSGNYYYYNRSCSNGFCVGATSDYCPNGCNDNGCL